MSLTPDATHRDNGFKRSLHVGDDTVPSNSPLIEAADKNNNDNSNSNKKVVGEGDGGELLIEPPDDNPLLEDQPSTAAPVGANDFPADVSVLYPVQAASSRAISQVPAAMSSTISGNGLISSISSVASSGTTTTMTGVPAMSPSNLSQTTISATPEVTSLSTSTLFFSKFHSITILTPSSNSSVFSSTNTTSVSSSTLPTTTSTTTTEITTPSLTEITKTTITTTLIPSPTIPHSQSQTPTQIEATTTNSNTGVLHARTIAIVVTSTIGGVSLLAVALLVLYRKRKSLWRKATWRMRRRDSIPSDFDFGTVAKSSISAPMPYYGAEYRSPPTHY